MFGALKWIVKQPVNAAKFVSRQAGTKMGRTLLTTIALTTAARYGGADVQQYAPAVIEPVMDLVANPGVGELVNLGSLVLMYKRDQELKDRQAAPKPRARRKAKPKPATK